MPSQAFAERILKIVQAKGYKPRGLHELAEAIGVGEDEQGDFHAACKALTKTGRIVLGSRNAVMLPEPPGRLFGSFRANPRGFGFVIPEVPNAHGDIYVPANASGGAMTGDRVAVDVRKRGKRGGKMLYEGRVTSVVQRSQSKFVGGLQREAGRWFVVPDGSTLHAPILIDDPGAKRARPGDQVVIEIIQYPTERTPARGVIVKALGRSGEPGIDARSIIEQFHLPGEFPENVLEEARRAVAAYDAAAEAKQREDLRGLTIITIDPEDAKDFDDAISLTRRDDGLVELGVHIADVAHFVFEGGTLDDEARERANSIYLPGMVIPMLPEVLSNGVCSLQERQPRLTKSAFITYDDRGAVRGTRFANTLIRSNKRLTYEQATAILDGKTGKMGAKVVQLLREMDHLARVLQARRRREGMLSLQLPDVELVFNEEGRVVDVTPEDTSFSHTIIEMFMVEANEALARLMVSQNIPCLRRVHEDPSELKDGTLRRLVKMLGYDLPVGASRHDLQHLLDDVQGKPEAFAINLAVLRSMQQAEYSPARIGHYALASENYCHFTSPIRRYPDLTVHRLLDQYLTTGFGVTADRSVVPTDEELVSLGAHCSANERRAEAAERELKQVHILRILEDRVGDHFDGVVTGIAQIGVFIQLDRYLVDGLLRLENLGDDWWEVDAAHGSVIGQRSGRRLRIGDRMAVAIAGINIPRRQLDLAPVDREDRSTRRRDEKDGTSHARPAESRTAPLKRGRTTTPRKPRRRRSSGKVRKGRSRR